MSNLPLSRVTAIPISSRFDLVGAQSPGGLDVLACGGPAADDDAEFVAFVVESFERCGVLGDPVGFEVRREDAPADGDDYLHWVGVPRGGLKGCQPRTTPTRALTR